MAAFTESQNHRIAESQNHRITESQNHRMVGVGRDLWGSSSPTLLPKQSHLQQAASFGLCSRASLQPQGRRVNSSTGAISISHALPELGLEVVKLKFTLSFILCLELPVFSSEPRRLPNHGTFPSASLLAPALRVAQWEQIAARTGR